MMNNKIEGMSVKNRVLRCVKEVLPSTTKTCIWMVKITVFVSFALLILSYFNILPYISKAISPIFNVIGLPGEAALPYITGYFVNVYAAISVILSFDFNVRTLTILSTMILCSHNIITETAVQKKTGSSAIRMVLIRTISAFLLAYILNSILPGSVQTMFENSYVLEDKSFFVLIKEWFLSTIFMVVKMVCLIYSLGILQKILAEFGVIKWLSGVLRPFLAFFGLPARTSFLWVVANTLGLSYGAAVMLDEVENGKVNKNDVNLLNAHISISHSNVEDLMLLSALGGTWYVILLIRWAGSFVIVWLFRLEYYIKGLLIQKNC